MSVANPFEQIPKESAPSAGVQKTVAAFLKLSGLIPRVLQLDAEEGQQYNCIAYSAVITPTKYEKISDERYFDSAFHFNNRRLIVHSSTPDTGLRKVAIKQQMQEVARLTFEGAKIRLHEIFHPPGIELDTQSYQEARQRLEATQTDFLAQFAQIPDATERQMRKAGKEIIKTVVPTIAQLLQDEQNIILDSFSEDQKSQYALHAKAQVEGLYNAELNYLSDRQRDVLVVEYPAVPYEEIESGKPYPKCVQMAIPLTDISTLDRRGNANQKRPNFWQQVNLVFDAQGRVIEQDVTWRAAAPVFDDIKDPQQRYAAIKSAIRNDLQLYVFMRMRKLLTSGAALKKEDFADMHIANLGLISAVGSERKMIMQIQKAYAEIDQEIQKNGLTLSSELVLELCRMFPKQDSIIKTMVNETRWFKPKVTLDNAAVNAGRGADSALGTKSVEFQCRKVANKQRIDLLNEYIRTTHDEFSLQVQAPLKKFIELLSLTENWDAHKNEYRKILMELKRNLDEDSSAKKLYDTLAIFAMHMDLSAKPQINPLSPYNIVVKGQKIVSGKFGLRQNLLRQAMALVLDAELAANKNAADFPQQDNDSELNFNIGGRYNVIVHCKSGKDRTGVVLAYKQALMQALNEERSRDVNTGTINPDLLNQEFSDRVRKLFIHHVQNGLHKEITYQNCPGTFGLLGQWISRAGVFFPLVYDLATAKACEFKQQNASARFYRAKWSKKIMANEIGANGSMAYLRPGLQRLSRRSAKRQLIVEEPNFKKRLQELFETLGKGKSKTAALEQKLIPRASISASIPSVGSSAPPSPKSQVSAEPPEPSVPALATKVGPSKHI